jgi:DNA polymerase III delta prime subunit
MCRQCVQPWLNHLACSLVTLHDLQQGMVHAAAPLPTCGCCLLLRLPWPCVRLQMAALRAGLDGTPLVLIQGPPGTGKTRTILNLLSVVMHSAAKGSLELVPKAAASSSGHTQPRAAAAAAAAGAGTSAEAAAVAERQRLWRLQSPWMFGEPTARDTVGPSKDTGGALRHSIDVLHTVVGTCVAVRGCDAPVLHVEWCLQPNNNRTSSSCSVIVTGLHSNFPWLTYCSPLDPSTA